MLQRVCRCSMSSITVRESWWLEVWSHLLYGSIRQTQLRVQADDSQTFTLPFLSPLCVNLGWVLRRAFTCKERRVLQGSFTGAGVSGFGDQRANPEGVLVQTHAWGLGILRCPVIPSSIKRNRTCCLPMSPRVIEYLSCIWFVGRGGGFLGPTTPEACNATPCNRSQKCACHLLPLGHG